MCGLGSWGVWSVIWGVACGAGVWPVVWGVVWGTGGVAWDSEGVACALGRGLGCGLGSWKHWLEAGVPHDWLWAPLAPLAGPGLKVGTALRKLPSWAHC